MPWKHIRDLFRIRSRPRATGQLEMPAVHWLGGGDNPWGVPVLDLRPVTQGLFSMSADANCAANAVSFRAEDGRIFVGAKPPVERVVPVHLQYRIDRLLADGVLFNPSVMEEKWALYYYGSQILCIRSWLRQLVAVADVRVAGEFIEVCQIRGALTHDDESPSFAARVLDYLLRSHALDIVHPVPLPPGLENDPSRAALWCFALFGNRARIATPHELPPHCPVQPLRTHSRLHIAAARGDLAALQAELAKGVPLDLLARDGLTALHWSLAGDDRTATSFLLAQGAPIDLRSSEGATPLMNAVQNNSISTARFLLDRGADPDAVDHRGFTSLHRAAEDGHVELVQLLLERGATPAPEAQGHTPRSLAESHGHTAIVRLLDAQPGA